MYTKENLLDRLVQYKGGGYDGCFWEWNFAIIRPPEWDKQFLNIHSSGRNGINNLDEMLNHLNNDSDYYLYKLDYDDLLRFARESNEGLVLGVARFLYDELGIELYADCTICENEFLAYDGELSGYEGCGGIAIQATELICQDCQSNQRCENCGELDKSTEYYDIFEMSLCVWCKEQKEEELKESNEDIFDAEVVTLALHNGHVMSATWHGDEYCMNCKAHANIITLTRDLELAEPCKG